MGLPIEPEPLEALRARYPAALEGVTHVTEVEQGGETPGMHRRHVFDCEDGLRLLISVDDFHDGQGERLHVSASFLPEGEVGRAALEAGRVGGRVSAQSEVERRVRIRFRELAGDDAPLTLVGWSPVGVGHWVQERKGQA